MFQWLIDKARFLIHMLVQNIIDTSLKFNREICKQYDQIVKNSAMQAENTEELVKQTEYIENIKVGELYELKVILKVILFMSQLKWSELTQVTIKNISWNVNKSVTQ